MCNPSRHSHTTHSQFRIVFGEFDIVAVAGQDDCFLIVFNRGNLAANESPPPTGGVGPVGAIIIIVEARVEGYGNEGRGGGRGLSGF